MQSTSSKILAAMAVGLAVASAGPDYEKWSCEKCNSDPDYQYCKWDGPTIGCLPKKGDGHHIPCGQEAGDVMIDKCPSGDWTSLAHRLLSKEQLERFARAVGDESAEMLRTLPNPGTPEESAMYKGEELYSTQRDQGEGFFNMNYRAAGTGVIKRECHDCPDSHKTIYYKRITDVTDFKPYNCLVDTWATQCDDEANVLNKDFELYSTLEDLKAGRNKWTFCNYNDPGVGFPRDCGPTGYVPFTWNAPEGSKHRARGRDVTYYAMKIRQGPQPAGQSCDPLIIGPIVVREVTTNRPQMATACTAMETEFQRLASTVNTPSLQPNYNVICGCVTGFDRQFWVTNGQCSTLPGQSFMNVYDYCISVGLEILNGEEYCESDSMIRNEEGCKASKCCHWSLTKGEGAFNPNASGRCWSDIGDAICVDEDGEYDFEGADEDLTMEPIFYPTHEPTAEYDPLGYDHTYMPPHDPAWEPTFEPTQEPIFYPTHEPTAEYDPYGYDHTYEPTMDPAMEPTFEPTQEPTAEYDPYGYDHDYPTWEPTAEYNDYPTYEPTMEPTMEPTLEPNSVPTELKQKSETPGCASWCGTGNASIDVHCTAYPKDCGSCPRCPNAAPKGCTEIFDDCMKQCKNKACGGKCRLSKRQCDSEWFCKSGVVGTHFKDKFCCPSGCKQCGGLRNGSCKTADDKCCIRDIIESGRICKTKEDVFCKRS